MKEQKSMKRKADVQLRISAVPKVSSVRKLIKLINSQASDCGVGRRGKAASKKVKGYSEQLYAKKYGHLGEMEKFLENHILT